MTPDFTGNQSNAITTESSNHSSSGFDFGVILSIGLFLLVLINLTFTLYFYISWKKKQEVRRRQSVVAEMEPYHSEEVSSHNSAEHIYAGVRESVATFQSGAYATLDSGYARVECLASSVQTRECLANSVQSRECLANSVQSRENCNRAKNKVKTLTTLFTFHSKDVENILTRLDPDYEPPVKKN